MFASTLLHSFSALCVLLILIGFGMFLSRKGLFNEPKSRTLLSKIVTASIPCFLFYSVISKFTHDELMNLLRFAGVPFLTVFINFLVSLLFVRMGLVRPHLKGTFIAVFSAATVLFVGVPLITTMYGADGIPYLLVYFFANCVFIWTVGLYNIRLDGVRKGNGAEPPKLISLKGLRMLMSPPLTAFLVGVVFVVCSIPVPDFIRVSTRYIGQITTPLALAFVGVTVYHTGFAKLKHLPREVWLVLFSCFILRPVVMYFCTMPLDMEPLMRKCFILGSALPVSSVVAALSKNYGGDEEFASEAIGASTIGMICMLPVLLIAVGAIE
jgi:predicted permease